MRNIHSMLTAALATLIAACSGQDTASSGQSIVNQDQLAKTQGVPSDNGKGIGHDAKVMTRNLYLGADLSPAIGARDVSALVAGAGEILRQVTATNFPVRAKGLAAEILSAKPDLVGLQECALWRTGPVNFTTLSTGPTATTVRYDYLQLLLDQLNADEENYRAVAVEEEFDFEVPADEDNDPTTGPLGADLNGRLTMRDVILARVDSGVHVTQPQGGHFQHLLVLPVVTTPTLVTVPVTRGWVKVEARVRGGFPFRFIDTHLEAFDSGIFHAVFRTAQANEIVAEGGPAAKGDTPVVLVGDLNSGDFEHDKITDEDDQKAYLALEAGGLSERSTDDPLSCCIEGSYDLTDGTADEFNHQVDHVMTNSPDTVRLVESVVTGRSQANGYWDSDHAGVFSRLRLR